ncbi:MAG: transposase, partial [Chloroflexi bacterium]|nr:transposase [Chloroflexota bacterium]
MVPGAGRRGGAVPSRRLEGAYPYVWLDVTFVKVRENGRVVSMAVVIAVGVKATGGRRCWSGTWATVRRLYLIHIYEHT